MSGDLEIVEARIAVLRAELDRLEITRAVLSELRASAPTPSHGKTANGAANGAAFTIKRVAAPPAEPEPKPKPKPSRQESKVQKGRIREKVMAEARKGPIDSSALCKKFHLQTAAEKQWVYQVMYELKRNGVVERLEDGTFGLAPPPVAEASATESAVQH